LAVIVCPESKNEIGHGNPSELIFYTAGKLMLRDEPDQAMGNRTTDFNPDWIGMIMLLISEPVKIAVVQERWRRAIEDVAMDRQTTDVPKQRADSL